MKIQSIAFFQNVIIKKIFAYFIKQLFMKKEIGKQTSEMKFFAGLLILLFYFTYYQKKRDDLN